MTDCPDCGGPLREHENRLTSNEFTTVLECPSCDFAIESVSNLVQHDH